MTGGNRDFWWLRKWNLLAFGFIMCLASSAGQTFFISFFANDLRQNFALSHGAFGSLYSIATLISAAMLIWAGRGIDRMPLKRFSRIVLAGLSIACVIMATSGNLIMLGVAIFLLRLFGQGLSSHTGMTAAGRYFQANRGKAVSITALGHSAGEAGLPILIVLVIAVIGWRYSWALTASVILLAALSVPLLVNTLPAPAKPAHAGTETMTDTDWPLSEVLKDVRLWLRLPALLAPSFISTGIIFHQLHLAQERQWEPALLATAFAAYATAAILAALAAGALIDRFSARTFMNFFLLPMVLAMAVIAWIEGPHSVFLMMAALGAGAGFGLVLQGALWAELYGTRHLGSIRAFGQSAMVFSTGLAPGALGLLIDAGWSFGQISLWLILYCALASGCVWLGMGQSRRHSLEQF